MSATRCDAHILVGPATLTTDQRDWLADCILNAGHPDPHVGPLDHAISTDTGGWSTPEFTWLEDDRRTYHGDYPGVCNEPSYQLGDGIGLTGTETGPCILPAGHPRDHAA